ncbi:hypothetical protein CAL65_11310 [Alkalilimnicola ehrlichii]|uniref:Transmembrane protein n=1 Tax=Alkalilimnicola ehrlichii TaxID=351052 RepID=A0A3E0WU78_9GAMM|nr:hypothetical protein CAL65_11310 [Alkalilimnicola ehrlichii]
MLDVSVPLGVMVLLGFVTTVIAGMLHKIVGFLVWLHLQQRYLANRIALRRLPSMYDIVPPAWVWWQLGLHAAAVCLLPISLWLPAIWQAVALSLLAAAFALLGWNVVAALLRYRRTVRAFDTLPVMPRN